MDLGIMVKIMNVGWYYNLFFIYKLTYYSINIQ